MGERERGQRLTVHGMKCISTGRVHLAECETGMNRHHAVALAVVHDDGDAVASISGGQGAVGSPMHGREEVLRGVG